MTSNKLKFFWKQLTAGQVAALFLVTLVIVMGINAAWGKIAGSDEQSVSMGVTAGASYGETVGTMSRQALDTAGIQQARNYCSGTFVAWAREDYPGVDTEHFSNAFVDSAIRVRTRRSAFGR